MAINVNAQQIVVETYIIMKSFETSVIGLIFALILLFLSLTSFGSVPGKTEKYDSVKTIKQYEYQQSKGSTTANYVWLT
jgi:uncharacterized protein HemY